MHLAVGSSNCSGRSFHLGSMFWTPSTRDVIQCGGWGGVQCSGREAASLCAGVSSEREE